MMTSPAIDGQERRKLDDLTRLLQQAFGEDLLSVVLYGSAARGDHFGGGSSDLNVAVVLRDISLESLERGTSVSRNWTVAGNRPPLFLSPDWIERSVDVFPMEFLDIVESHQVLHGQDPFAGLDVSRENLRLQCELEVKIKMIHLRTAYLERHDDTEALARALAASYASVVAICRGILRLAGRPVPAGGDDVVRQIGALCALDPEPFAEAAAIKRGGPSAAAVPIKPLFRRYYSQIERLASAVDAGFPKGVDG